MRLNKSLFAVISVVLICTTSYAQFHLPKTDKILEMKNRQLIVIINEPDPRLVEKYSRERGGQVADEYKQEFGNYNEEMKYIAKKFWTFNSQEILFKTWAEVEHMTADKSQRDKYIVMYCFSEDNHKDFEWRINGSGNKISGTRSYFTVCFPDDNPLMHFHLSFSNLIPSATDLAYVISTTNAEFNYVAIHQDKADLRQMVRDNAPILSHKTLLVLKSSVPEKLVGNISTWYPCSYRLVEDSIMENAVLSADTTCVYIMDAFSADEHRLNWIVNCADGAIIAFTDNGTPGTESSLLEPGLRNDFFEEMGKICSGKK